MPRLSTPCPRPHEQGPRKNRHEALQLEVDEGRREARRVQPGCGEERVRVLPRRNAPRKAPSLLLGQLGKKVVRVPHENRAVLEEGVRPGGTRRKNRARNGRHVAAIARRVTGRDQGPALPAASTT